MRSSNKSLMHRFNNLVCAGVCLTGLAAAACGTDQVSIPPGSGPSGILGTSGGMGIAGSSGSSDTPSSNDAPVGPASRASFCAATGAGGILLPGTTQCTGDVAKKLFRFGVCSCAGLTSNGPMVTRSFNSQTKSQGRKGGSIGANGDILSNSPIDVGGSVVSSTTFEANGGGRIAVDLRADKGASSTGPLSVGGDYYATVAGDDDISVSGATHVPATVLAPCDCKSQVPIAAYVDAFASANDDAASGLTPKSLEGVLGADLTLDCGRYYFNQVDSNGTVTIRLKGRTAIFVAGNLSVNGGLSFVFEPGAELDLFVKGNLLANGSAALGNLDAPAKARIYLAGSSATINGESSIAANLYAPNAKVDVNGELKVRGAVYAQEVGVNGGLDLNYDEAILDVQGCEAPGGSCKSCGDCGGATPACKGGKCTACKTNADCCAPLACAANGTCIASLGPN
jgi:hypothetical protein